MTITFETLAELKAFYCSFKLKEGESTQHSESPVQSKRLNLPGEIPSRKGKQKKKINKVIKEKKEMPSEKDSVLARRRSVKPKTSLSKNAPEQAQKSSRKENVKTMSGQIEEAIQKYSGKNRSFTANDIYAILVKKDESLNKQSVVTSVLKQMNSTFAHVSVGERAGKGPRPVKLYNV